MYRVLATIFLFLALVGGTWLVWQHAFEVEPGYQRVEFRGGARPPWQVLRVPAAFRWNQENGELGIRAGAGDETPTAGIPLDGWPSGGFAHVRMAGRARQLEVGPADWQTGRVMMMWLQENGQFGRAAAGLGGFAGDAAGAEDWIVPMEDSGRPLILLQNLGKSGEMVVEQLEVRRVRLRGWAALAAAGLLGAWCMWLYGVAGRWIAPRATAWRLSAGCVVCTAALYALAFPGPWRPYRPVVFPFDVPEAGREAGMPGTETAGGSEDAGPGLAGVVREVPGEVRGGLVRETFQAFKEHARWLLHMAAFAGLAAGVVWLTGDPRSWVLVAFVAVASEAMQTAFGFGFLWEDVADLVLNGLGIAAGTWGGWKVAGSRASRGLARKSVKAEATCERP